MAKRSKTFLPRNTPAGLELMHTHYGHTDSIWDLSWSPDGQTLASASSDGTVRLWNRDGASSVTEMDSLVLGVSWSSDSQKFAMGGGSGIFICNTGGEVFLRISKHASGDVLRVAWSADDTLLASAPDNKGIVAIWRADSGDLIRHVANVAGWVRDVIWLPDGSTLALASSNGIHSWDAVEGKLYSWRHSDEEVHSIALHPDLKTLYSAAGDGSIYLHDTATKRRGGALEGHLRSVNGVRISPDGRLLVSFGQDRTARLWRIDRGEVVASIERSTTSPGGAVAFHPTAPILATTDDQDESIRIWRLDYSVLLGERARARTAAEQAAHYANAKVVLVGNTSVGKTGLGLVLAGRKFRATESSHGRHVWTFDACLSG